MFPSRKHTDAAVAVLFGDAELTLSPEMQQEMDERLEKMDKPSSFGLTTGMTFSTEFSNTNPSNGITSYPLFGATYGYRVHPKLRFYTGIGYEARGGLVGNYSYTIKYYGFGSTQTDILVSPKSLHYVKVPLFASIQVYNRHYLTAGASAGYLINVSSSAETQFPSGGDSKEKIWGYKQGFSNHDIQLQVGYRYYIGKGFTVNAEASFGVNDLTDNAFFQNDQKDTNTQFRLRLAYDLFNF